MAHAINLTGRTFHRLTVISRSGSKGRNSTWNCKCTCGNMTVVVSCKLTRKTNSTKSCGCLNREKVTTHGLSKHPDYAIFSSMYQRCYNPKVKNFHRYGGRGITVCDRWRHSFENFHSDMGFRPHGMSIDRINNDDNYTPENCRWATIRQQANNTRTNNFITCHGETMTLANWSRRTGISSDLIRARIHRLKWSVEKALTTPTHA